MVGYRIEPGVLEYAFDGEEDDLSIERSMGPVMKFWKQEPFRSEDAHSRRHCLGLVDTRPGSQRGCACWHFMLRAGLGNTALALVGTVFEPWLRTRGP